MAVAWIFIPSKIEQLIFHMSHFIFYTSEWVQGIIWWYPGHVFQKYDMQLRGSINLIHFNLLKYVSNNTFRSLIDNRMAQLLKRIITLNVHIDMQVSFYKGLKQMYFSLVCIFINFFNVKLYGRQLDSSICFCV